MSTYVSPIGSGFGDVLISLPVVQALLDLGESVHLVTRSFRQEGISPRIAGVVGEVREDDLLLEADDKYINLRAHPLQTDYLWGTPEFEKIFGLTRLEKIITTIANDFGLAVSYKNLRPLKYTPREDISGQIIFVPGTDGHFKHWPLPYWIELKESLDQLGLKVTVLGRPDESPAVQALIERHLPWIATPGAGDAIDAVSSARAVVAVDTGLMHVAVQQNIPTFSFVHPDMFHHRTASNSIQFIGQHCPSECGRETALQPGVTAACHLDVSLKFQAHLCPLKFLQDVAISDQPGPFNCMSAITPQAVLESMRQQGVFDH